MQQPNRCTEAHISTEPGRQTYHVTKQPHSNRQENRERSYLPFQIARRMFLPVDDVVKQSEMIAKQRAQMYRQKKNIYRMGIWLNNFYMKITCGGCAMQRRPKS